MKGGVRVLAVDQPVPGGEPARVAEAPIGAIVYSASSTLVDPTIERTMRARLGVNSRPMTYL